MNNQVLYNIQQADEIRKLKEERDQLIKIIPDLLNACKKAENFISGFEDDKAQRGVNKLLKEIRAAIQNATR